jgi:hypothetical protein
MPRLLRFATLSFYGVGWAGGVAILPNAVRHPRPPKLEPLSLISPSSERMARPSCNHLAVAWADTRVMRTRNSNGRRPDRGLARRRRSEWLVWSVAGLAIAAVVAAAVWAVAAL